MGEAALEKLGGPGAGRGRSWLRTLVRLGVVGLVLALAAGGVGYWLRYGRDEGPLRGTTQRPAPALVAADDPSRGSIAILVDGDEPLPGPEITVGVTAPDGARQMQLGFDPSFETTPWVPVDEVTTLVHHHTGHQILFARFRSGPGATPSPVSTVGVTIDPTYVAATSSVDGLHQASWIRSLGPDRLAVRVEGGRMSWGAQEPYDFDDPPAGDRVNPLWGVVRVSRDGEPYGVQVDGSESLLRRYDRLIGRPVDTGRLDDGLWLLTDSVSGARINVTSVERISRPAGTGTGHGGFFDLNGEGDPVVPLVHDLIVRLAEPLAEGRTYDVQPPGDVLEPATYTFTENETRSPAIHVNQAGYGVDDPLKVGYLSRPYLDRGSAGEPYAEGMAFTVVDEADGTVVLEGEVTARPEGDELNLGDLTGAPVFEADFSALSAEGRFRLCVATVGCSEGFSVGAEVWADLTKAVARAMYHQRSGVALGPPYTPIGRPRPYHPDDGMVIRNSDYSLLDSLDQPLGDVFDDLVAGNNGEVNPDAWGGHFDAGDWDRRIQHLFYVRSAVELVELAPERYAGLDLQIPESGDQVPDLIDEALWTLDVFYRLQRDDGAVRGGIEASQHPLPDNTSWSDDLAVFA
ncbi:MAG: cellulase N-terminal Ig-like domain-containing protein, partial [Actinomycetota bacterium]